MLVSRGPHNEGIQVTNDGATILKSIGVDNPAAKVLVGEAVDNNIRYHLDANIDFLSVSLSGSLSLSDISMVQDDEVGDGTTSVTVLACELLKVIRRKRELKLTVDFVFPLSCRKRRSWSLTRSTLRRSLVGGGRRWTALGRLWWSQQKTTVPMKRSLER